MNKLTKGAGIAGLAIAAWIVASPSVPATQLGRTVQENEGVVTDLGGGTRAVSYWASAPDGWHVVTTVDTVTGSDTDAEQHAIVRFSATLAPGQEQLISVPLALGQPEQILRIHRVGNQIEMERIADRSI